MATSSERRLNRWLFAATVVAVLALTTSVEAYSPWYDWRTLKTPNFRIHYPAGYYEDALHFGRSAETVFDTLVARLGWRPSVPIDMVLNDDSDGANGFARSLPYNLIGLNAAAPGELSSLNDYDDWRNLLITHELVHIVHIDTVYGLPRLLNFVLGRRFVPNGVLPRWLTEGMATYFESDMTSAGRIRNAFFRMQLRAQILEGRAMDLAEAGGAPQRYPQGGAAYLYGGFFVDYLVERFGESFLREINRDYGDDVIPFGVNLTGRRALGAGYPELFEDFVTEKKQAIDELVKNIERQGRVEGRRLTTSAQRTGPTRYAPDGTLYYVADPIDERPSLRRHTADGYQHVASIEAGAELAIAPSGRHALVSYADISSYFRIYDDLHLVDLDSGERTQLTFGARASDPDWSPDNRHWVFVQRSGACTVLRLAKVGEPNEARVLVDFGPNTQIFSPRFLADGEHIVFGAFVGGQRDLYRVAIESGAVTRLTNDRHIEGGAVPSADGEWIYFHNDADGIFNLYAMRPDGGGRRRLTRVVTAALRPSPSPDGTKVAYMGFGAEGFDVFEVRIPADIVALPVEEAPASLPRPLPPRVDAQAIYPAEEYTVWPSILPRSWFPIIGTDPRGTTLGVSIGGQDAVDEHTYGLDIYHGIESGFTGFGFGYTNGSFFPGISLGLSRQLQFANALLERNGERSAVQERAWSASASTSIPIFRRINHRVSALVGYSFTHRDFVDPLALDPLDTLRALPSDGRFASAFIGAAISNARGFTNSISNEQGGSFEAILRLEDPLTGSEYRSVSVSTDVSYFLENPFIDRHVLALRAGISFGASNYIERSLFGIAGLPRSDILLDLLSLNVVPSGALRGFPLEPIVGNAVGEYHLEYRFPIWDIQRGIDVLPAYFRNLSGVFFSDGATVTRSLETLGAPGRRFASAGAELRLRVLVGYGLGAQFRLGYGRAVLGSDSHSGYAVLGGNF